MRKITHQDKSIPISRKEILAASLLTVPVYCSVLTPIDMVKNRLQIQSFHLRNHILVLLIVFQKCLEQKDFGEFIKDF
jgi:hypothetical protein